MVSMRPSTHSSWLAGLDVVVRRGVVHDERGVVHDERRVVHDERRVVDGAFVVVVVVVAGLLLPYSACVRTFFFRIFH